MNYLVFLDPGANELEKILSGVKCMITKEVETEQTPGLHVEPGDNLYFLRDNDEFDVRVKATVKSIQLVSCGSDEDISHHLKEMQPRLQLTEAQYNDWSSKKQLLLIEFENAQKIGLIHLAFGPVKDRSNWIAFEAFSILASRMFQ